MTAEVTADMTGVAVAPSEGRRLPWSAVGSVALVMVAWEVAGRLGVASGAFPPLSEIASAWWAARADYRAHTVATFNESAAGFAIGNIVAIALAILYQLVPATERLMRTTTVVLFCMPIVVAAPILGIALPGWWPQVVLAALLVFFPTLLSTHLGLRNAPGDAVEVVRASGGGRLRQLRLVRLRAAVPDALAGMQIAAPAAVLGAMLGEFLGSRHGLGIYLIGSMGRGRADIVWAIGLTATALSAGLYGLVGLVRHLAGIERSTAALDLSRSPAPRLGVGRRLAWSLGWSVAGFLTFLALWLGFIGLTGLPRTLMNGPQEVVERLFTGPHAAATRERIAEALGASLWAMGVGGFAGIGVAFVLAMVFSSFRNVARIAMPLAFVSQTVPIVALAPLIGW